MFNQQFDLELTLTQISGYMKRKRLKTGRDTKFKPGQTSHNKGKRGVSYSEATQFKPGHKPASMLPVGSEVMSSDGYLKIKIADPNYWIYTHVFIWERHNGPVPKGHVIIFGDQDRLNFGIDNLILVSRAQLLQLNRQKLIKNNADLTRVGVAIVDLKAKIRRRAK